MIFLVFMGVSFLLVGVVYLLFSMMSYSDMIDFESISGYECGFDLMANVRVGFSYRFFLMAILFLVFDVEIVLLLPTPYLSLGYIFYLFILILGAGLFYEFFCGSLEWV